jgi:hypothetical protein
MSKLGAKKSAEMKNNRILKRLAEPGADFNRPTSSAIVLADVQHLGKAADAAFFAAVGEDDSVAKQIKAAQAEKTRKGPSVRRIFRRNARRLSSMDLRVVQEAKKPVHSRGKRAKLFRARFRKYAQQTRLLIGLLIRGTGTAAPSLIAHNDYVMPAYKRRIAEIGTSISKPNLRSEHADI